MAPPASFAGPACAEVSAPPALSGEDQVTPSRALLITIIAFSGASSLIDQVAWVRLLTSVLGTSAPAVSIVVAVFMAGLAGGAAAGGWLADRWPGRALRLLAVVEAGIALGALAVAGLLPVAGVQLLQLLGDAPGRWSEHLLRLGLSAAALLPPTLLMGATLPLALRARAPALERAGAAAGWLYAANTAGAAVGAAAAGLVLLEHLGVQGSVLLASGINLANAVALEVHGRRLGAGPVGSAPTAQALAPPRSHVPVAPATGRWPAWLAAAMAGFVGLGLEVAWTRALVYRIGNSTYAFTAVLLAVLVGIAAGSAFGSWLAPRTRAPRLALGAALIVAGLGVGWGLGVLAGVREITAFEGLLASGWGAWPARLAARSGLAWLVVLPAATALGMVVPLANQLAIRHVDRLGRRSGRVLALNTVGAVVGALAVTYVLVPALGTVPVLRALASCSLLAGAALALPVVGGRWLGGVAVALLGLVWLLPAPALRGDQERPGARVLFEREDPEAHVRLYVNPDGTRHVGVNGWSIGSDAPAFDRKQTLVGLLPFALRDASTRVLIVGLGSGSTLSAIASQPQVESIDVVEIVPSVVEAARHFGEEVASSLEDPRVRVEVGDGIHHLAVTSRRYDVISSDGKLNPQFAGNAYLYSEEYYRRARGALSSDGLLVQWLPAYLPAEALRMVLRTFTGVFEGRRSALFFFPPETILLVGSPTPLEFSQEAIAERLASPGLGRAFQRFGYREAAQVASARLAWGSTVSAGVGPGPRSRWLHPRLEFIVPAALAAHPTSRLEARTFDLLLELGRAELARDGLEADAPAGRRRGAALAVLEGLRDARRTGSYAAGLSAFERARRLAPQDPRVRWALAAVRGEREALEAAVRERPEDAEARRRLGRFLYRSDDFEAARAALRRALELAPDRWRPWSDLGDLHAATGDAEGAIHAYQEALARGPRRASLLANLAAVHFRAGNLEQARRHLEEGLELAPEDAELLNSLGILSATEGALIDAEESFRRALRHDPTHLGARNNLAGILLQMGRTGEAISVYEAARERDADNVAVLVNLARAYAQEQRWQEADKTLSKVLRLEPDLEVAQQLREQLRSLRGLRND